MAETIQDRARNMARMFAPSLLPPGNAPAQMTGRLHPYYEGETAQFRERYAQYAADYFEAEVQGLDPEDFFAWAWEYIRFSDIAGLTATSTYLADNAKLVLFANSRIQYAPRGAKIVTVGSTWLVTNPENISGAGVVAVAERCNAVWNHLDYYGNLCSEPLVVTSQIAKATASDPQDYVLITKGYFNVKCQYNADTAQLDTNSRMILGSGAYSITGYSDFHQEFTGDYGSVRMLEFALRYEEPNREIDDLERHVASGLNFSWEISIQGKKSLELLESVPFSAVSLRCGTVVEGNDTHPVGYLWHSSDPGVATVDKAGIVRAEGPGTCEITAFLAQNPEYSGVMTIQVAQEGGEGTVRFLGAVPDRMGAYQTVELEAAYEPPLGQPEEALHWSFARADPTAYSAVVEGNRVSLSCWRGSVEPLVITAQAAGVSVSATIELEGI